MHVIKVIFVKYDDNHVQQDKVTFVLSKKEHLLQLNFKNEFYEILLILIILEIANFVKKTLSKRSVKKIFSLVKPYKILSLNIKIQYFVSIISFTKKKNTSKY